MNNTVSDLAFHGEWSRLFDLLRTNPHLINHASEHKAYTPLHQAAWHGASLNVIGTLFAYGASRRLKTNDRQQTAQDIAIERHHDRPDLEYVLNPGKRTVAQLIRKIVANDSSLFGSYDGNKVVCNRMIEIFTTDLRVVENQDFETRIDSALNTITGTSLLSSQKIAFRPAKNFELEADITFWRSRFLGLLRELQSREDVIPIEKDWAVVADLFDPAPEQWGRRGDLFLWMEMRQALCHVEIPTHPEDLANIISSSFSALTGMPLTKDADFTVKRFLGECGAMVSCEFWLDSFIPLLKQRASWLQSTWQ